VTDVAGVAVAVVSLIRRDVVDVTGVFDTGVGVIVTDASSSPTTDLTALVAFNFAIFLGVLVVLELVIEGATADDSVLATSSLWSESVATDVGSARKVLRAKMCAASGSVTVSLSMS
jgi:hypothetical protein